MKIDDISFMEIFKNTLQKQKIIILFLKKDDKIFLEVIK
jgi:hypothetical protein